MATAAELLSSLKTLARTQELSLLPSRTPLAHRERAPASEKEVLLNNLSLAIYEEYLSERESGGGPARASEEILLQRLAQGTAREERAPVPQARPRWILDLGHRQDTDRLPDAGEEGLCCGKKHYWKGATYDMVLPIKVLGVVAIFPFNAGDNLYDVASSYCQRKGIHDFAVLEGIVKMMQKEIPERFRGTATTARGGGNGGGGERKGKTAPFVPILQKAPTKKQREKKEKAAEGSGCEQRNTKRGTANGSEKRDVREKTEEKKSSEVSSDVSVALSDSVMEASTVDNTVTETLAKREKSESQGENQSQSESQSSGGGGGGGQSISEQLREAQARRRQEHARKQKERNEREAAEALEKGKVLARDFLRQQEERARTRRDLEGLSQPERLRRLMEQLQRIEEEERARLHAQR